MRMPRYVDLAENSCRFCDDKGNNVWPYTSAIPVY